MTLSSEDWIVYPANSTAGKDFRNARLPGMQKFT